MASVRHDFLGEEEGVFRGSTWTTGLGFDTGEPGSQPVPIAWSGADDIVLTIKWRGGSLIKTKAAAQITIDDDIGAIFWTLSNTETLLMPRGRLSSYEIEARFPTLQLGIAAGEIEAFGGLTNG